MSSKQIKPTEGELEILQVLWEKGRATVRDVHETILKTKDAGYTTTLKLMQIMFEKGLVKRDDSMKTHIYQANVSKERTQNQFVGKMINSLFGGSSTSNNRRPASLLFLRITAWPQPPDSSQWLLMNR